MTKSYIYDKHFSIAEALEILHIYKPMIQKMRELSQKLLKEGYDIYHHKFFTDLATNSDREFPKELDQLIDVLKSFNTIGIQVKSFELGLVDFPHIRANGEEVYLCYKSGEETIGFWHRIDAGFAGRQALSKI